MPRYPGHELKQGDVDPLVCALKARLNRYRDANPVDDDEQPVLRVKDQLYTGKLEKRVRQFQHAHGLAVDGVVGPQTWTALFPESAPLRQKALNVMTGLLGVVEVGGNNTGPMVMQIIKANGGVGPESWCGDAVAYAYRLAGSKAITGPVRNFAWVPGMTAVLGVAKIKSPQPGDVVRFQWDAGVPDHTGLFERWIIPGQVFSCVEGNTHPGTNVSDSNLGDGVYRRERNVGLVYDYLRVSR